MNVTIIDAKGNKHEHDKQTEPALSDREIMACKRGLCYVMSTNDGELFNPHEAGANIYKKDRIRQLYKFNLQKCSQACYDFYIRFLQSRNKKYLLISQRRFIDGN